MPFSIQFIESKKLLNKITLLIFVNTVFILFFFEPFGDIEHGYTWIGIIRILTYGFTAASFFYLSERFIKQLLFRKLFSNSNNYLPLYWYFIELFIITIGIFLCRSAWIGFDNTTIGSFFLVLYRVFIIAIIPFVLLIFIVLASKRSPQINGSILLCSNDKNAEYLKLDFDQILFLQSEENYTSVFYLDSNMVNQKLLRGSLSYFEKQVKLPLFRVHRSHIVNLGSIKSVDYNSQGGILYLKYFENPIRISRKRVPTFQKHWQDYYKE